ncbi:DUF1801 domain-containing protein [Brevundimonas sp. NPDC092305]|uniref:DUF1801 domain-containing protein n=1 Tax=Brevundimonas sp. NPDC092305 TaxID=3363957 RepID=UPI0037FD0BC3
MAKTVPIDEWLAALDPDAREDVEQLRRIVRTAAPALVESIKWNAPNYALAGRDRVTLGLNRKSGYRVVLHRGVEKRVADGFIFEDPDRIGVWPTPDRGVVTLPNSADIASQAGRLETLIRRWIAATED